MISRPIELGWWTSYRVIANSGNRFAVSPSFRIRAGNPIQDVVLTLPEPQKREIHLIDQRGQPASGVGLALFCDVSGLGRINSDFYSVRADANGLATVWIGNDEPNVKFTLQPTGGGFIPMEVPVTLSKEKPAELILQRGNRITGRILEKSTNTGVAGVGVRWTVWKQTGSNSTQTMVSPEYSTTDQNGRFEFIDAPAEKVFLEVEVHMRGKRVTDASSNSLHAIPGGEEVIIYLEDDPAR